MHEIAVGDAVGRFHVDVGFRYGDGVGGFRQHHGNTRSQHHAKLLARYQSASFILLPVVLKMILITHGFSPYKELSGCATDPRRMESFYTVLLLPCGEEPATKAALLRH